MSLLDKEDLVTVSGSNVMIALARPELQRIPAVRFGIFVKSLVFPRVPGRIDGLTAIFRSKHAFPSIIGLFWIRFDRFCSIGESSVASLPALTITSFLFVAGEAI